MEITFQYTLILKFWLFTIAKSKEMVVDSVYASNQLPAFHFDVWSWLYAVLSPDFDTQHAYKYISKTLKKQFYIFIYNLWVLNIWLIA